MPASTRAFMLSVLAMSSASTICAVSFMKAGGTSIGRLRMSTPRLGYFHESVSEPVIQETRTYLSGSANAYMLPFDRKCTPPTSSLSSSEPSGSEKSILPCPGLS